MDQLAQLMRAGNRSAGENIFKPGKTTDELIKEREEDTELMSIVHSMKRNSFGISLFDSSQHVCSEDVLDVLRILRKIGPDKDIDLIIHTPGGSLESTETIAKALLNHRGKIRVYIPYKAHSAGTLIALCGNEIYLGLGASLTPVDQGKWMPTNVVNYLENNASASWVTDIIKLVELNSQQSINRVQKLCHYILSRRGYNEDEINKLCNTFLISSNYQHDQVFVAEDLKSHFKHLSENFPNYLYDIADGLIST